MVGFLTLFLGLVLGPHDVRVMVDDTVAAVELRLDGVPVARIEGSPWKATVDFGDALVPRRLEAVSLDAGGRQLELVTQSINRPRPRAEAVLLVERDGDGRPVAGRLSWQAVGSMQPSEVSVTVDGQPLAIDDPDRFPLPTLDAGAFHFLQADLTFEGGISAHTQTAFGGLHTDETTGDLTAVPVQLPERGKPPDAAEAARWFLVADAPQRVVAVEKGPAEVILVRQTGVNTIVGRLPTVDAPGLDSVQLGGTDRERSLDALDASGQRSAAERQGAGVSLSPADHLRLALPWAKTSAGRYVTLESFAVSPRLSLGLFWALTVILERGLVTGVQRTADAVAVAAQRAAWGNRRRAVVLALMPDSEDASVLPPRDVLHYLRALGVPLYVWRFGTGRETADGWPQGESIVSFHDLKRAVQRLRKGLEAQRVVWIAGGHAPESIELAAGARYRALGETF